MGRILLVEIRALGLAVFIPHHNLASYQADECPEC